LTTPPPFADAAQQRFHLFDAVTELWKRAAASQTLVLIFEDLHWADEPSLRLMEFVAGGIASSRILLIGTLRDAEGLSGNLLGELARKASLQRIRLAGFTIAETSRLLQAATAKLPSESTAAFVHSKTDGNPLFVSEMAHYLDAEGLLTTNSALDPTPPAHLSASRTASVGSSRPASTGCRSTHSAFSRWRLSSARNSASCCCAGWSRTLPRKTCSPLSMKRLQRVSSKS
jgi:hypothetical protein